MRTSPLAHRTGIALVAVALVAACTGGDGQGAADTSADTSSSSTTPSSTPAQTTTTTVAPTRVVADGPLSDVCPRRVEIQLADLPSVEHGPLVRLFGETDPSIDVASQTAAGPIQRIDGTQEDVELVLRAGGPAIGFRPATTALDQPAVLIAEATTANVLDADVRIVAALTQRSHQALMWDPSTYPDVHSIADLGEAGIEVLHFTGAPVAAWARIESLVSNDQLRDGFDGEPASFVAADGAIAQQADSLVDPFLYPSLPAWGRPVAVALAADEGWPSVDDLLVAAPAALDEYRDCLGRLLPLIQEAILAEASAPSSATSSRLASMRATLSPLTRLGVGVFEAGARAASDSGIWASGEGTTVAWIDPDRVAHALEAVADVVGDDGSDLPTDDLVDMSLLDPTIEG